jgi:hypothetical protein
MSDPVDMVQLVRGIPARPRGRACIVLTHDYAGQREWAAKLARKTGSGHIDLLEAFAADDALSGGIERFSVTGLFEHLAGRSDPPVLIVSGMEFLKATWTGQSQAIEQFARRVETWDGSPALLFVLQHDKALAAHVFGRHAQHTFVVDQMETYEL